MISLYYYLYNDFFVNIKKGGVIMRCTLTGSFLYSGTYMSYNGQLIDYTVLLIDYTVLLIDNKTIKILNCSVDMHKVPKFETISIICYVKVKNNKLCVTAIN